MGLSKKKIRSNLKRSRKQEKAVAQETCGKTRPGSGNQWHSKGDVINKSILVSCKTTESKSYRLSLKDLDEVSIAAFEEGLIPAMCIDISGRRVWVIEDQHVAVVDKGLVIE